MSIAFSVRTLHFAALFLSAFSISVTCIAQRSVSKTEVLILGTSHLHHIKDFKPHMVQPVVADLDLKDFDVVAIERMPAQLIADIYQRQNPVYDLIFETGYGTDYKVADSLQRSMQRSLLDIERDIDSLLAKPQLEPEDRMTLIKWFLAANDEPSASLQYQFLKRTSAIPQNSEFEPFSMLLEKSIASHNEYYSLAAPVALRENIQRLVPIDDYQDMPLLLDYYPTFMSDYEANASELKAVFQAPVFKKIDTLTKAALAQEDFSELYRYLNSKAFMTADYETQWDVWLKTDFSSNSDHGRYSLWEMRNLQIAANILKVVAKNPEARILAIIGASHKSFLEKYLKQVKHLSLLTYP